MTTDSTSTPTPPTRTLIWCQPEQAAIARAMVDRLKLDVVEAGGPTSAATTTIASELDSAKCVDLRHAVFEVDHDLVLLFTLDGIVAAEMGAMLEAAGPTATLEPIPGGISDAAMRETLDETLLVPRMRKRAPMKTFEEIREDFGTVRSVSIAMRGRAEQGSLYARLTDAMDVLGRLSGPIEMVDATLSGPSGEAPANLRTLNGHLTLNARFAVNCSACVQVSNMSGSWSRGITILGDGGCVRLTDTSFEWRNNDGEIVDHSEEKTTPGVAFEEALAEELARLIDPHHGPQAPREVSRILAECEAVRLSLRTGQGESPRKLLDLVGG